MYNFFCPFEGMCRWIVGIDETVNGLSQFLGGHEACSIQRISRQKGKPDLYLVQPACMRGDEMKMNALVPREPHIPPRLMRAEVVHNDVDFPVRMGSDYAVHEIQELYPSSPLVMPGYDLTGVIVGRIPGGSSAAMKRVVVPWRLYS